MAVLVVSQAMTFLQLIYKPSYAENVVDIFLSYWSDFLWKDLGHRLLQHHYLERGKLNITPLAIILTDWLSESCLTRFFPSVQLLFLVPLGQFAWSALVWLHFLGFDGLVG